MHRITRVLCYWLTAGLLLCGNAIQAADSSDIDVAVWVDVRSQAEYNRDHIAGDLFIPHTLVVEQLPALVTDKDSLIYLYCRSGHRAGLAKRWLQKRGYSRVENAGGIADARRQRGLLPAE